VSSWAKGGRQIVDGVRLMAVNGSPAPLWPVAIDGVADNAPRIPGQLTAENE
jgi:hypothetical protein